MAQPDPVDQTQHWLDTLATEKDELHQQIHAGASSFLQAVRRLPEGEYRRMALCKISDAVMLAYIAARPN